MPWHETGYPPAVIEGMRNYTNFPECEKSSVVKDRWCLVVTYTKGKYRVNVQNKPKVNQFDISGMLYFSSEMLPDYLKDPISIIKVWTEARTEITFPWDSFPTPSIAKRPDAVPVEFEEIGWMRAPDKYVVVVSFDQLVDLYNNAPRYADEN